MPHINIQLSDDRIIKSAATTTTTANIAHSTTKTLETLLLASNRLRQRVEITSGRMEAIPRTRAIDHALVNQNPSSSSGQS